jgi:16S rRNA (cytosine967-C5)-methyltransferase
LSRGIDHVSLCRSFFIQPDLFLRIRPGHESLVRQKLEQASMLYRDINSSCLALANASKIDTLIEVNKEAVIQDFNSQKTGEFFQLSENSLNHRPRVWDCCCASGGKSILAYDILHPIDLTVSDIRKSILHNLRKRLKEAEIDHYTSFIADLTSDDTDTTFDLIIADLPCTGSGTWSRTPEELCFFEENKIEEFAQLQRNIISHLIPHLKKGSRLVYITCSVFRKENEENVRFIESEFKLKMIGQKLLMGYEYRADSLFVAHFQL